MVEAILAKVVDDAGGNETGNAIEWFVVVFTDSATYLSRRDHSDQRLFLVNHYRVIFGEILVRE